MQYQGNREQIFGHISYSQHGDDLAVANVFHLLGIKKPTYLDLGAHHPFEISNTALLYSRGCRGVNVEANENLFFAFKRHRPEDVNVCIGVAPGKGRLPFYMLHETHGLNSFVQPKFDHFQTRMVDVITLDELVEIFCPNARYPDFLNCDIEDLDFDVLNTSDFAGVRGAPKVVCVEVRWNQTQQFEKMMNAKSYFMLCRCSENIIFVRNELKDQVFKY